MKMSISLIRPLRRFVTKKCGGYKRLLLVLSSLVLLAYSLRAIFNGDGRQIWDVREAYGNASNPCTVSCPPDQLSFYIRTGEKMWQTGSAPVICFQGTMYMSAEQNNVGRGLNVVLIDSTTGTPKSASIFDTYLDESALLRFLKKDARDKDILLLATYDDASYGLKESGRHWLKLFGSSLIDQLGFRENFIMIGHRGLATGSAIEYHITKTDRTDSFAPPIEKAGCFAFPLGERVNMVNTMPDVLGAADMKLGARHDNCGLPKPCPEGSVSVSVDTGDGNSRQPSICVGDFVRLDGKTNNAGRGFNIVTLDNETLKPKRLSHLDTYTFDSTDLELMLESLDKNEIVIAVIADDASKKLGQSARDLLNKLGSGHIQNLRFRDAWYFVGQKDIHGFTRFEELSFATFDGGWPKPLLAKFCVPSMVPTSQIMIEPQSRRNDQRRQFCLKYEGYIDFCNPANVDDELKAIVVASKDLKGHEIFNIPIMIVPGMNHNAYVHTLQTVLMQPGIKVDQVAVFWDEKLPEYGELATMFGFLNHSLDSSVTYSEQMIKALKMSRVVFPDARYMIVIEEDILLAPDFMSFMAQCLHVIKADQTLAGAFAWNINGFEDVSNDSRRVYRVQEFPGLGVLMRSKILQHVINTWEECCTKRAWTGWQLNVQSLDMLMPEVSRVYRTPFFGAEAATDMARSLFLKPRKTYLHMEPAKLDLQNLISSQYEDFLHEQIQQGEQIQPEHLLGCVRGKSPPPDVSMMKKVLVVYYHQSNSSDLEVLVKICRCFGLVTLDNHQPKNLYNGLLRFSYQEHDIFLIGTMSEYFSWSSNITDILSPSDIRT